MSIKFSKFNVKLSPPSRAAWIEIRETPFEYDELASPPSRAAWIEIFHFLLRLYKFIVAAFTGGVDGNRASVGDRYRDDLSPPSRAAWIEMLTDGKKLTKIERRRLHGRRGLKLLIVPVFLLGSVSPPSRAAWIEIVVTPVMPDAVMSPPSRAAWIEIRVEPEYTYVAYVAAFTGGVDGNRFAVLSEPVYHGRRLHGRRGLKGFPPHI